MSRPKPRSLLEALLKSGPPSQSVLSDGITTVPLQAMTTGTCLAGHTADLIGRSVLVAVATQLEAALVLIELDGLARRLVLCPPDLATEHLQSVITDAEVDAIACTDVSAFASYGIDRIVKVTTPVPIQQHPVADTTTEWLMFTSGTTGKPKMAIHSFAGLTGAIKATGTTAIQPVWATFYDIRRFGGLQIFLRAMLMGSSIILSRSDETISAHLQRLGDAGVSHISGTPTHWRRALMSSRVPAFTPQYLRLSGEIADQAILDALKGAFPRSSIAHAYASTEAGVGFEVTDGLEGFPANYIGSAGGEVEMNVRDGALQIRSPRMASFYAGRPDLALIGSDGFVDTGDIVELRGNRYYFVGRRGGIINVGGLKVHPEEIETVINRHAAIRLSRVRSRKSPIIGAIVVADIMLNEEAAGSDQIALKSDIMALCKRELPPHKIPAVLNVVAAIETTIGGKIAR